MDWRQLARVRGQLVAAPAAPQPARVEPFEFGLERRLAGLWTVVLRPLAQPQPQPQPKPVEEPTTELAAAPLYEQQPKPIQVERRSLVEPRPAALPL